MGEGGQVVFIVTEEVYKQYSAHCGVFSTYAGARAHAIAIITRAVSESDSGAQPDIQESNDEVLCTLGELSVYTVRDVIDHPKGFVP